MEFQKARVFTALNADELKIGSKVICANNLDSLRRKVYEDCDITEVKEILNENYERRFQEAIFNASWPLAYLVSEPEETWIVYVWRGDDDKKPYLTSCRSDRWEIVQKKNGAKTKLFEGTDDECDEWYEARRHLTDIIAAWEDGKTIQCFMTNTETWEDLKQPSFQPELKYRIKPEGFKWTDMKIGDIVTNGTRTYMIIGIDSKGKYGSHILFGNGWITDGDLRDWGKVE